MAISVRHAKVSGVQDSGDGKVSADAWNDNHNFICGSGVVLGRTDVGIGPVQEVPISSLGGGSGTISAADRDALALSPTNTPIILTEAGREGVFLYSSGDFSDEVTADPDQGIYVPPSLDPTGGSGAWIRKSDGPVNVKWFGTVGDNATDDSPAFVAAIAYLKEQTTAYGYSSRASQRFYVPHGEYYLGTTTLDIDFTVIIEGDSVGAAGGGASVLRWAAGTTGLRVQTHNTTGASGTQSTQTNRGDGSIFQNLYLKGAFTSTEAEAHGIHLRGRATIRDCVINGFEGDGIFANCTATSGGATEGNANNIRIENCRVQSCRNGLYLHGADVNAGNISACEFDDNRQWGVWDSSFLGNTYSGIHASGNGATASNDGANIGASIVSYSGNQYYCKTGQATGASTNAPSGTTAGNTWWGYIGAGAAATGIPAWVSGLTIREGGAYHDDNVNARNLWLNCYSESSQGPAQFVWRGLVLNGLHSAGTAGYGGHLSAESAGLTANGALTVVGALSATSSTNTLGPNTGTSVNSDAYLDSTATFSTWNFRSWAAGVPQTDGLIKSWRSNGLIVDSAYSVYLRNNNNDIATVSSTGLDIASGKVLKNNSVQIASARKTGWAVDTGTAKRTANATYSGTAEAGYTQATVQTLMDAVRDLSQTVKALKDDLHGTAGHGLIGT